MAKKKGAATSARAVIESTRPNPVAIRFSADEREWLRQRMADTGASLNTVVRVALGQYIRRIDAAELRKVSRATGD